MCIIYVESFFSGQTFLEKCFECKNKGKKKNTIRCQNSCGLKFTDIFGNNKKKKLKHFSNKVLLIHINVCLIKMYFFFLLLLRYILFYLTILIIVLLIIIIIIIINYYHCMLHYFVHIC